MINNINKENAQHSSKLIPYSYYRCDYKAHCGYVPLHWHNEFEINYIVNGAAQFRCANKDIIANKGDIVIITPNTIHSVYPYMDFDDTHDALVFSSEMFGLSSDDRCVASFIRPIINGTLEITPHITKDKPYYDEIKKCTESIFNCVKINSAQYDLLLKSELLKLLWILSNNGEISKSAFAISTDLEELKPAIQFITENYREDITIDKLSELSHLSKSYFMNRFKQYFGIGAMEYIIQLRIKSACEALQGSNKTITQISSESGFNNLSNFNRQFKKTVGCTPKEYRNY